MKLLNILNGDDTLYTFNQTGLPGETLVWREVLSEGPVSSHLGYSDFFQMRSNWVSQVFNSTEATYQESVLREFNRLTNYVNYDEILLWFEFDLHCQINLIFLLNYFQQLKPRARLSLICPNQHPNHPDFRGIGQLSPEELSGLIAQKIYLKEKDLAIASNTWKAYSAGNQQELEELLKADFGQLDKLEPAIQAHLKRFPNTETGLNFIEELLIEIVESGLNKRTEIYMEFWKNTAIYGMSDTQIELYLEKLLKSGRIVINTF